MKKYRIASPDHKKDVALSQNISLQPSNQPLLETYLTKYKKDHVKKNLMNSALFSNFNSESINQHKKRFEDLNNKKNQIFQVQPKTGHPPPSRYGQKTVSNPVSSHLRSNRKAKYSMESFRVLGLVGKGSFGEVYLVEEKKEGKKYALKQLNKKEIQCKCYL